jgi:PAS domain S-box-containing protein
MPAPDFLMMNGSNRDFFNDLECVVLEADPESLQFISINSVVNDLFGYPPDRCQVRNFLLGELVHPDDVEFVAARLARLCEGAPMEVQFRAVRADGQSIRVRGLFTLTPGETGARRNLYGLLCEHRDVSESINLTEDRLQLALDAANMGVWDWNVEDSTIFWSENVYRLHGFKREELGNLFENYLTLVERVHPQDVERVQETVRQALSTGHDYEIEYRFRLPEGPYRWIHVKGRIYTASGVGPIRIAGTAQDITAPKTAELAAQAELVERKRAEAELTRLAETLESRVDERTSKLQETNALLMHEIVERRRTERELARTNQKLVQSNRELQEFAYIASHDLKEPLRKISTFADLLQYDSRDDLDEDARFYVERMQESASRMMALIDDLLQFSRIKTSEQAFRKTDLNEILANVLSDIELGIRDANGTVKVEGMPSINADPTQMRQLFQNLITNALKFRRKDVTPQVRVFAELAADEKLADVRVCRLIVEDNGIGFDEQYSDRIFAPFQRLHTEYEGTGMGLAICRRIVERHHGNIQVASKPGGGSRFVIELPPRHLDANDEE